MIVRGCTFYDGSRLLIALGATPNSQQVDWTKTAAVAGAIATHTRLTGSLILLENNSFYENEDRSDEQNWQSGGGTPKGGPLPSTLATDSSSVANRSSIRFAANISREAVHVIVRDNIKRKLSWTGKAQRLLSTFQLPVDWTTVIPSTLFFDAAWINFSRGTRIVFPGNQLNVTHLFGGTAFEAEEKLRGNFAIGFRWCRFTEVTIMSPTLLTQTGRNLIQYSSNTIYAGMIELESIRYQFSPLTHNGFVIYWGNKIRTQTLPPWQSMGVAAGGMNTQVGVHYLASPVSSLWTTNNVGVANGGPSVPTILLFLDQGRSTTVAPGHGLLPSVFHDAFIAVSWLQATAGYFMPMPSWLGKDSGGYHDEGGGDVESELTDLEPAPPH